MHSNKLAVIKVIEGYQSCQAIDDIESGSFLTDVWGQVLDSSTRHTLQVGEHKHVRPEGVFRFFNHSCQPNSKFIYKNRSTTYPSLKAGHEVFWYAVAARDIKKGDDVTSDYNATEYEVPQPFQCNCGNEKCLGVIKGFKHLSPEHQKARVNDLSPVITELWHKNS